MNELATAIYNRSQVAGNYKTSINGRQYFVKAPSAPTYPFVVFFTLSENPDFYLNAQSTTASNFEIVECVFNIHSNDVGSSSQAGTILTYLKAHYDNCALTVSGWNNISMERDNVLGPFWNEETQEWIYSVSYQIILQKS